MASFLSDHNVIRQLITELRDRGHAVLTAEEADLDRAEDREILLFAGRQGLIALTGDSDFGVLHRAGAISHAGILLIRPFPVLFQGRGRAMADAIERLLASEPPMANCLHGYQPAGWLLPDCN